MAWINWVLSSREETHLKSEFPLPGYRIKFLKQFDFAKQNYHPYILKCQRILSSLKHFWKPVFLFSWVRGWEGKLCFSWASWTLLLVSQPGFRPFRHSFFYCQAFSVGLGPNPISSLPFSFNGCNYVGSAHSPSTWQGWGVQKLI